MYIPIISVLFPVYSYGDASTFHILVSVSLYQLTFYITQTTL